MGKLLHWLEMICWTKSSSSNTSNYNKVISAWSNHGTRNRSPPNTEEIINQIRNWRAITSNRRYTIPICINVNSALEIPDTSQFWYHTIYMYVHSYQLNSYCSPLPLTRRVHRWRSQAKSYWIKVGLINSTPPTKAVKSLHEEAWTDGWNPGRRCRRRRSRTWNNMRNLLVYSNCHQVAIKMKLREFIVASRIVQTYPPTPPPPT